VAYPGDGDRSQGVERSDSAEAVAERSDTVESRDVDSGRAAFGATDNRSGSMPVLDVVLDPVGPGETGRTDQNPHGIPAPSPERTAVRGLAAGLAVITAAFVALFAADPSRGRFILSSVRRVASPAASTSAHAPTATSASASVAPASVAPAIPPPQPIPGPWRLAQLATTPEIKVVEGTMDRRSFLEAVGSAGVPRAQIYRVLAAFSNVRKFDRSKRHDTFAVALELPSRRVRAFEYQAGPTEIYQARERDDGSLVGEHLDLHVEKKRASAAVVVGEDLATSLQAVGFDPSLVDHLDDALEGRAQLSSLHAGSRLRIVADYETALGAFARYLDVPAIEYLPAEDASALRVYRFHDDKTDGYFDAKGHQPYKGGFRSPIPFARISSGFNMHRMHPILHVVMPHNGIDFAASSGTPVYAACYGNIEWIGDGGASGNLITIRHAGGITTGYAHLSRYAPHLAQGQSVETRQLIGYVGSTGRSTGPHLHFSAKKNGVFIDPMTLRLDGDKVLPKPERPAFEEERAALDKMLDAIPLPPAPPQAAGHAPEPGEADEPMEEAH
jgi:murein DD-endopeptidase MepM/ murein hydrolase activator NlpD